METKFDKDEFSFAYPDGIENNYWHFARNKIILNVIKKYSIKNGLDVGSGRGIVTDYLFRNKISIKGVELGNTTPINNSNVPILYNADALSLTGKFDAITLFDVIEHIEKPVQFMKELIFHFKDVEYLIITVPARKELWSNFDEYYGHFKRYELNTLKNELQEIGFEIIENQYFFHVLYFLIRLNNRISKKRKIQFIVPKGLRKVFHSFLGQLFFWEKFITPKKLVGSSIICIAKKKHKDVWNSGF